MAEAIAFPDAEAVLYAWLTARLAARSDTATVVGTLIPNPRPARLVRAVRKGGTRRNLVQDQAMMAFDCWDETEVGAAGLTAIVRAEVGAMDGQTVGGSFCYRVTEVGGPYNNPDPDSANPRYTFSAQIILRGSAI